MSETDTYYRYKYDRVLIETSRMYRPEFAPAAVQLTGAQVEMLRNMTQYLNRPNTYVEEYEVDKYLTPSASQFDGIQAIVANLEEKLMGNENVIWGYTDRYIVEDDHDSDVDDHFVINFGAVSADEVLRIHGVGVYRASVADKYARVQVVVSAGPVTVADVDMPIAGRCYTELLDVVLKEGDNIRVTYMDATIGETVLTTLWGYKMVVP